MQCLQVRVHSDAVCLMPLQRASSGLIVEKWKSIRCKKDSVRRERGGTEFEGILGFTPSTHSATEIRQPKITQRRLSGALTATASVRIGGEPPETAWRGAGLRLGGWGEAATVLKKKQRNVWGRKLSIYRLPLPLIKGPTRKEKT